MDCYTIFSLQSYTSLKKVDNFSLPLSQICSPLCILAVDKYDRHSDVIQWINMVKNLISESKII